MHFVLMEVQITSGENSNVDSLCSKQVSFFMSTNRLMQSDGIWEKRNIAQNPEDEHYKCLKLSNSTFFKNVWRYDGARQFLLKAGWKARESEIIFEDPSKLDTALTILLTRRTVSPEHDEWTGDVLQGPSKQQLREKELKEKAVVERNKELAEFFKNKEERRRIAECVKAEHIADRKRLELLKPNVSNLEAKINVPAQGT